MSYNVTPNTKVFAVLGNPVMHSMSPLLFNSLFKKYDLDALYLFLQEAKSECAMQVFRSMNLRGMSVTIPHKESIYNLVDEIDDVAKAMQCINTVAIENVNGKEITRGYNFDGIGALNALKRYEPEFAKRDQWILGAGGSARGIAVSMVLRFGIKKINFAVRNVGKVNQLKTLLVGMGCEVNIAELESLSQGDFGPSSCVINTTPIGMHPKEGTSPLDKSVMSADHLYYDIVYNPLETEYLKSAKDIGAKTLGGVGMFVGQAAGQFKTWFGFEPDIDFMTDMVKKHLQNG